MTAAWHGVWSRRNDSAGACASTDPLQRLIDLYGFDSGAGRIDAAAWRKHVGAMAVRLGIKPGDSVYELGCGAGAFLFALQELGANVAGMDYAQNLVDAARKALPGAAIAHGEASALPTDAHCDFVVANSVFHYFPDAAYAADVLHRMLDKARKAVAVLEVPDAALRTQAETRRRDLLSVEAYEAKYQGLDHLYLPRDWFTRQLAARGLRCETFDQCVPGYAQNDFRFNCIVFL